MSKTEYIQVEKINDGWLFTNWTNEAFADLHPYFDKDLIDFFNEFEMIKGHEKTYFIHGFASVGQSKDFAIWYHKNRQNTSKLKLLDNKRE